MIKGELVEVNFQKPAGHMWSRLCTKVDLSKKDASAFIGEEIQIGRQKLPYKGIVVSRCDSSIESASFFENRRKGIRDVTVFEAYQVTTNKEGNFDTEKLLRRKEVAQYPERFKEFANSVKNAIKESKPSNIESLRIKLKDKNLRKILTAIAVILGAAAAIVTIVLGIT